MRREPLLSALGAIAGAASPWLTGLYSLLLGATAVLLSLMSWRRGGAFSLLGLILGGITIIFVNLQFVGLVKATPEVTDDIAYLFRSIRLSNQAYKILKDRPHYRRLSDEGIRRMVTLWEKAIEEAEKVNVDNINVYIPDFGEHYKGEFIKGLKLLIEGFKGSDDVKKLQGAFLMDKWGIWNNKNRDIYRKITRNKSFLELLYEFMTS